MFYGWANLFGHLLILDIISRANSKFLQAGGLEDLGYINNMFI